MVSVCRFSTFLCLYSVCCVFFVLTTRNRNVTILQGGERLEVPIVFTYSQDFLRFNTCTVIRIYNPLNICGDFFPSTFSHSLSIWLVLSRPPRQPSLQMKNRNWTKFVPTITVQVAQWPCDPFLVFITTKKRCFGSSTVMVCSRVIINAPRVKHGSSKNPKVYSVAAGESRKKPEGLATLQFPSIIRPSLPARTWRPSRSLKSSGCTLQDDHLVTLSCT